MVAAHQMKSAAIFSVLPSNIAFRFKSGHSPPTDRGIDRITVVSRCRSGHKSTTSHVC
jgi:hypothetical protein